MNWEMIGWIALAASGLVILASFFVGRAKVVPATAALAGGHPEQPPIHAWLEIAWPVFFIAIMGMLTLKEVMGFPAVLLLATALTGIVRVVDALVLKKARKNTSTEPVVVEMARSFFPVILVVFLLRSFLVEPFKIPSGSMMPTLLVGDFILVNKFTYGIRLPVINHKIIDVNLPKRGEVMVFRYPKDTSLDYIKRVIGIPGDQVIYRNKQLTLNGQPVPIQEKGSYSYIASGLNYITARTMIEQLAQHTHETLIQPESLSVYINQVDSQFPYRKNCEYNDEGFTCTVPPGYYFMMGDNRDSSNDSRYWGFVPEQNIVGKAFLVWWNFDDFKRIGRAIN